MEKSDSFFSNIYFNFKLPIIQYFFIIFFLQNMWYWWLLIIELYVEKYSSMSVLYTLKMSPCWATFCSMSWKLKTFTYMSSFLHYCDDTRTLFDTHSLAIFFCFSCAEFSPSIYFLSLCCCFIIMTNILSSRSWILPMHKTLHFVISENIDLHLNVSVDEFVSKKATNKLEQQTKVGHIL